MHGNQKTDSTNYFRGNNYQSEFIITSKQLDTNTLKSYPVIKVLNNYYISATKGFKN